MSRTLVVGGGPAGAAFAARLASAGRQIVLIERETAPHDKVCGEFISWEASSLLRGLGVDPQALGAAPIRTIALARAGAAAETALPHTAWSLSRRRLDEALLACAERAGVEVLRGRRVTGLRRRDRGWCATLEQGEDQLADIGVLATGKHDLRDWRRPPGPQGDLIAFKMHWRLAAGGAARLDGRVELYLFPGGYAGLEPIEGGRANLCLLVKKGRFTNWPALLARMRAACPVLDARLEGATPCWDKPLAVAAIPYGHVARPDGGPWRLGDQAAVIPSFAGDGLAIALHSARLAADALASGGTADEFQACLRRQLAPQVGLATLMSRVLVDPLGQLAARVATSAAPGLMALLAQATRIPSTALASRPSSRGIAVALDANGEAGRGTP